MKNETASLHKKTVSTLPVTHIPTTLVKFEQFIAQAETRTDYLQLKKKLSRYLSPEEISEIHRCYLFTFKAHDGQTRKTGEAYISHPIAVTSIVADWFLDLQGIMAALMHDVMEDTLVSKTEISENFGAKVADLVDGLSKLDKMEFRSYQEAQAENFCKMLIAMSDDIRVILVKLADRMHNMRTLSIMRPEKRRRIADETLDIYAPIANRLGLHSIYRELQDLAFRNKYPMRYRALAEAQKESRNNKRDVVHEITKAITERLPQWKIDAKVTGRDKALYSIYHRMVEKNQAFSQVMDMYGFRIVVKSIEDCYLTIGALHSLYKPFPGRFKDYIALPKINGYQSIHTTLIGPFGLPVEIQVLSEKMQQIAESGVAAQWLYQDSNSLHLEENAHSWLETLVNLKSTTGKATELLEQFKRELFSDEIYVFTPKGKIISLPSRSTPVDFAYAIHSHIGNCCIACRINGELMSLRTPLRNGDKIEIIVAAHANPNPAWLSFIRTTRARASIRHFLKNAQLSESLELGNKLLNQALRPYNLDLSQINILAWERFLRDRGVQDKNTILMEIGEGKRLPAIVAKRLLHSMEMANKNFEILKSSNKSPIKIDGNINMLLQLSTCCYPIPGDSIVGLIRKGSGLEIHNANCKALPWKQRSERGRWIDVNWEADPEQFFDCAIKIIAHNTRESLAKITSSIAAKECNITRISQDNSQDNYLNLNLVVKVHNRQHLAHLMHRLHRIHEVIRVHRVKSTLLSESRKY